MNWKEVLKGYGFESVPCWDIEARHSKPEAMGWPEYKRKSGVSIAGLYDMLVEEPFGWQFYSDADTYPRDMNGLSEALCKADMTVGYNTMSYDHSVVFNMVATHNPDKELDLYNHVIVPSMGQFPTGKGLWNLNAFCMRTIGHGKTLTQGAHAPVLCKEGRWGELVTYNLHDVALVAGLFKYMLEERTVILPNGDLLEIGDKLDYGLERVGGLRQESVTSRTA